MIFVLLFHLEWSQGSGPVLTSGWAGVDLFFVLSGFLITGILLETRDHPRRIRNFFARRVLRIFPLYYFVLFLLFVVAPFLTSDPSILYPNEEKPFYLLYVQNLFLPLIKATEGYSVYLSHTWSLAIEEQYYLVWPWLVLFLPRRLLVTLLVLVLVAAPIARYQLLSASPGAWTEYWLVYRNTLLHIDGLAIGSLLAFVVRSKAATARTVRNVSAVLALVALPYAFWKLNELRVDFNITHYPYMPVGPWVGATTFTILSIGFCGLLGVVLTHSSRSLDWILGNPISVWIGSISYGLYVYHFPVFLLLRPYEVHPLLALATTFSVAALSWYLLEKPFLRLKSRFV